MSQAAQIDVQCVQCRYCGWQIMVFDNTVLVGPPCDSHAFTAEQLMESHKKLCWAKQAGSSSPPAAD